MQFCNEHTAGGLTLVQKLEETVSSQCGIFIEMALFKGCFESDRRNEEAVHMKKLSTFHLKLLGLILSLS